MIINCIDGFPFKLVKDPPHANSTQIHAVSALCQPKPLYSESL